MMFKPFFRCAGGKSWAVPMLPPGPTAYCEPFLGAGALFLSMLSRRALRGRVALGDASPFVAAAWRACLGDPGRLAASCHRHGVGTPDRYYAVRRELEDMRRAGDDSHRLGGTFLWLSAHSYKGLVRVSKSGAFNVPWGHRRSVELPRPQGLAAIARACEGLDVSVQTGDFWLTAAGADLSGLLVCDPPYVGGYVQYTEPAFNAFDRSRLACLVRDWPGDVLSFDSACPEALAAYSSSTLSVERLSVRRSMSDGSRRGPIEAEEMVVRSVRAHRTGSDALP